MSDFASILRFIREQFDSRGFIPLHAPVFAGREKACLNECVDSTFVSSVGAYVDQFEEQIKTYTGAKRAVAVVNGTQGLFVALKLAGVGPDQEVITQALSFVATSNAILYTGAEPVFLDVDQDDLGLSPKALKDFLEHNCLKRKDKTINKATGREIGAVVPMHCFGMPAKVEELAEICQNWNIPLIEDAAESLGSFVGGRHTGTLGKLGVFSFNGNKVITTGGGGMLVTMDEELGAKAKHLTTTAKLPHPWEFNHDQLGYNFRLPNLNAALGVAQMEQLPQFLENKRQLALAYQEFFKGMEGVRFLSEPVNCKANYWLCAVIFRGREERDAFLKISNDQKVMTRPLWTPLNRLSYNRSFQCGPLVNTDWLFDRLVNLPSSVRLG